MTAEKFHDALSFLPADLVAAADKVRSQPRRAKISWKRWVSMAACLAVILFGGWLLRSGFFAASSNDTAMQMENAKAAAPAAIENEAAFSLEETAAAIGGAREASPEAAALDPMDDGGLTAAPEETAASADTTSMTAVWKNQATTVWHTSSSREDAEYPQTMVIRSQEELDVYYAENEIYYDFSEFSESLALYDGAWFEENDLLVVVLSEYDTVIDLVLNHDAVAAQEEGNTWELLLSSDLPDEDSTAENGCWHILMDVRKDVIKEDDTIIAIFE